MSGLYFRVSLIFLAASAGFAQTTSQSPRFEAASVRRNTSPPGAYPSSESPGGVRFIQYSLSNLLMRAFNIKRYQLIGPSWLQAEYYDVVAKAPEGTTRDQLSPMLQSLLVERFQIKFHRETRELPAYAIIVDKNGPKLKASDEHGDPQAAMFSRSGHIEVKTVERLASLLSIYMDRPVQDMTGVHGTFDIRLDVSPDELPGLARRFPQSANRGLSGSQTDGPSAENQPSRSLASALRDLGLRLESRKASFDCIVVDAAQKTPAEN
jgi:uncharacterized protein (TIGR03435 family)